jgi:hypothetical protein
LLKKITGENRIDYKLPEVRKTVLIIVTNIKQFRRLVNTVLLLNIGLFQNQSNSFEELWVLQGNNRLNERIDCKTLIAEGQGNRWAVLR